MSLRFRRSIQLFPGIRLNLGKSGIGISAGIKGLRVGANSRGQRYTSIGLPGTGLSMRQYSKRQPQPKEQSQAQTITIMPFGWAVIALGAAGVLWLFWNVAQ